MKRNALVPQMAVSFPLSAGKHNTLAAVRLRRDFSAEGYGIYIMLIELLLDTPSNTLEADYQLLAYELRCEEETLCRVIEDYGLFEWCGEDSDAPKSFYSPELMAVVEEQREKNAKRVAAANKRWKKDAPGTASGMALSPKVPGSQDAENQSLVGSSEISPSRTLSRTPSRPVGFSTYDFRMDAAIMAKSQQWIAGQAKRLNMDASITGELFSEFVKYVESRQLTYQDTKKFEQHFVNWSAGKGRNIAMAAIRSRQESEARESEYDRQREERNRLYDEMRANAVKPADYIRSKGYDPAVVSMAQLIRMESNLLSKEDCNLSSHSL